MENVSPTPELLRKLPHEKPEKSLKVSRETYRIRNHWETITGLEAVHRECIRKLEQVYHGANGVFTMWDSIEGMGVDDDPLRESYQTHCFGLLQDARHAVGLGRPWKALENQIEGKLTTTDLGHQWARIKGRQQAKGWGDGLVCGGLDRLALHWRLVG